MKDNAFSSTIINYSCKYKDCTTCYNFAWLHHGELSQAESTDSGATRDAGDTGNNGDSGDYCSAGLPITYVMDLASSSIKCEIKHKNNTESLKTKLECVAAARKSVKVCFFYCCC